MLIYIINIALIAYWWVFYDKFTTKKVTLYSIDNLGDAPKKNIGKTILLLLPFIQIYFLLALKDYTIGTDTVSYINGLELVTRTPWKDILNFKIVGLVFNFERGFIILSKLITMFTVNFTAYSAIIYVIMVVPLYLFIKKYSTMPFLSVILFIYFGFLSFYFSGMRQALAISLILLSYDFIVRRKLIGYLVIIVIATTFHKSAIFFLPAYFLTSLTITPLIGMFYSFFLIIVYTFRFQILKLVTQYIYSGVKIENTGAYTLLIIVFTTFFAGMFVYKKVVTINKNNKLLYNIIAVAAALMIFNTISDVGLRVANYYYIFMILFIPNLLESSFRDKVIKYIVFIVLLIFTSVYYFQIGVHSLNGFPYKFYWE